MSGRGGKAGAMTKAALQRELAVRAGVSVAEVDRVLAALGDVMGEQLRDVGEFRVPTLMKVTARTKPASEAREVPDPFNPGATMRVAARPARRVVRVRPLIGLRRMVEPSERAEAGGPC